MDPTAAEAASGEEGEPTDLAAVPTPFYRQPVFIFGGLAVVAVGAVVAAKAAKGKGKKKAKK